MNRLIAVVTGTRAEFGLLKNLIRGLFQSDNFKVKLLVTGSHLSKDHGNTVDEILKEEETFGIKDFKTYQKFAKKVYEIRENVLTNIKKLKDQNKTIIGYGAPAKATTSLNFFGISKEIDFIVEDNKFKHNKFIPGVKIPIKDKSVIKNKKNVLLVLAWNFFDDIKHNNKNLSENFVNIKDLEINKFR